MKSKQCAACGKAKPKDQFYRDRRKSDGLHSSCKICHNARTNRYAAANREKVRAMNKAHYAKNKDKLLIRHAQYREENREKRREICLRWYYENKEQARAISRAWSAANREKGREKTARYRERYPERIKAQNRRSRRHRKSLDPLDSTACEYTEVLLNDRCGFCSKPVQHIDHIEPIARGGANAWNNLAGLCAFCNGSKHARPLLFHLLKMDRLPQR